MFIKKIKISNLKSFKNLKIDLDKFNPLIGPNAAGKSNFIEIFKFLRDIGAHGLNNAISMQGGIKYLRNINIGVSQNLSLEVVFNYDFTLLGKGMKGVKANELIYGFTIKFGKEKEDFTILKESMRIKCEFKKGKEKPLFGKIIITRNTKGLLRLKTDTPKGFGVLAINEKMFSQFFKAFKAENKTLFIEKAFFLPMIPSIEMLLSRIQVYKFDPESSKKAASITGKMQLEEDGRNLAIVLNSIKEDKEKEKKFSNLINNLLPFIERVDIEKFKDKSLFFKIREKYFKNFDLPAFLISDGTTNIINLIIALYFERKELIIIEEPERNIHPYLISRVVEMLIDASETKQIIVTTHSPEMVKHSNLKNILIISRDKAGFSIISRIHKQKEIKKFLHNGIDIEDLYTKNLL